jgi:hypothetical protein
MRFTEQIHVVELLREAGEEGLHVDNMAAKLNVSPSKLGKSLKKYNQQDTNSLGILAHSMRLLATHHVFTEVSPDVFKNNR